MTPKTRPTRAPHQGRGWSQARHSDDGLTLGRSLCGCSVPVQWTAGGLVLIWRGREKHLGGSVVAAGDALNRMKCPRCGKMPRRKQTRTRQAALPLK